MLEGDLVLHIKYPWQQVLLEAFMEFNSKQLPSKIDAAQRAISARLSDVSPADLDERLALRDALRSLHVLFPTAGVEAGEEEEIAAQQPQMPGSPGCGDAQTLDSEHRDSEPRN
jgi:hypothetical protein